MITIRDVTEHLESFAPPLYQEDYDNSGLLTGHTDWVVTSILLTLDCTEDVVKEAIDQQCNLIIAHHPIIFKGIKKLNGKNYVERTIIKAIQNNIAIYAIHTNLDNFHLGVNRKIADKIGLLKTRVLAPKKHTLGKLVTFIPKANENQVMEALHAAGAGNIGAYKDCSFVVNGTGSFTPTSEANPTIGKPGQPEKVDEVRAELIYPVHLENRVLAALFASHPYEEVAYYLSVLENQNMEIGAGIIGTLASPEEPIDFLRRLKKDMNTSCIRHTSLTKNKIKKVAVCGGSGSFLLQQAISAGADIYISADFKYHEFFDADGRIIIADIGHYESEQFTSDILSEVLSKKFTTFAINFSRLVTNPISYL